MHCAHCRGPLGYVHGHAACLRGQCPMFGVNQAECCSGEHGDCPPTSMVATPAPEHGTREAAKVEMWEDRR